MTRVAPPSDFMLVAADRTRRGIAMTRLFAAQPETGEPTARLEDLPDYDLLEQFFHGNADETQDAFRAIVGRHGPSVLAICRRVLDREHDAEDTLQATFLVLARDGASISDRRALPGWLREVAYRIAVRTRARASRRRALERRAMAMTPARSEPADQDAIVSLIELRPVLQEEVARLPEEYRLPVILSYLEGRTNREVAQLLNWPVGTVKGRLMRARQMLRSRLSRRGLDSSEVSLSG
jgi:RNA polymerase sigma factor (sigma-70 family)